MFHFRLQSVLDVRERITRLRQKDYSEVLARRQLLEAQIEQHEIDLARAARDLDEAKRSGPSTFGLQLFANYRRRLNSDIERLTEQIREQEQELEAKRRALVEARRAQRTLEILRDKERARYEHEQNRRERATMDEVASNYHVYRQQ